MTNLENCEWGILAYILQDKIRVMNKRKAFRERKLRSKTYMAALMSLQAKGEKTAQELK